MGGRGSGTWYRWNKRLTCEESRRLDIRFLRRRGMLRPGTSGSLYWSVGGERTGDIRYNMFDRSMQLIYKTRWPGDEWEHVNLYIWFDETPCNYGGTRKWFLCPGCDRRAAVLYLDGTEVECRRCSGLLYASQGEGRLDRLTRKLDKISNRLEADEYIEADELFKPKGMHWRTFYRLKMAEIDADEQISNAFLARFGHWL